jgi:hypothetical protein
MARNLEIPKFKSEAQEAAWWDSHQDLIAEIFRAAKASGRLQRLSVSGLLPEGSVSKTVSIRLPSADLSLARNLAAKKGMRYQTLIKALLHEALEREKAAS